MKTPRLTRRICWSMWLLWGGAACTPLGTGGDKDPGDGAASSGAQASSAQSSESARSMGASSAASGAVSGSGVRPGSSHSGMDSGGASVGGSSTSTPLPGSSATGATSALGASSLSGSTGSSAPGGSSAAGGSSQGPVAPAVTLVGPARCTVGIPSAPFQISLVGAPAGTVGVDLTVSGGGALSRAHVDLTAASPSATFTLTADSAGTKTVQFTNARGLPQQGSPLSVNATQPVLGGTWEQLSVAPHQRKVITLQGNGTVQTFDPTKALALEAQAPQTATGIPLRAFSTPVQGERGTAYYVGGLHSNYQGNEVDRLRLPTQGTVIQTTVNHPANMPPEGPASGYASGNGAYIYRQYGGGLADNSLWQPYPGHQWTKNGWNPYFGFFSITAHALQTAYPQGEYVVVGGVLQSSGAQPTDVVLPENRQGVVGYDWEDGRYRTHLTTVGADFEASLLGATGVADWNNYDQSTLFAHTNGGYTRIKRWNPLTGLTSLETTGVVGGYDGASGNGHLIRHLEARKYLWLRQDANGTFAQRTGLFLYSEDFGAGNARFIRLTPPAEATSDLADNVDALTFCVDKNSRRVFWLVFPGVNVPVRFYVSTFEDLMDWTPVLISPDIVVPNQPYLDAWLAGTRQPLMFEDGYLYLMDGSSPGPDNTGFLNGSANWKRAKVDPGEPLPEFSFHPFDYRKQAFTFSHASYLQLWGTKHVNWAYRTADNTFYMNAGDAGASFTSSMATLAWDSTPRGYTFTEILSETEPAPLHPTTLVRQQRPVAPDDGYWAYLKPNNPEPAFRDKFLYVRGGDGIGYASNIHTRAAYASTVPAGDKRNQWNAGADVPEGVEAMQADGWTLDKMLVFDPTTRGFQSLHIETWPWDSGAVPLGHPALLPSAAARNGALDETTNHLFRFTNYNGSMFLVRYDLVNHTIRGWNVSSWYDVEGRFGEPGRRWFTDGLNPTTQPVVADFGFLDVDANRWHTGAALAWEHKATWLNPEDGKLYVVSPGTGFLWCYETRGAETDLGGDGYTIPFYPVGQRVPLHGTYPPTNTRDRYPPVNWAAPGSGTNGDVAMNSFLVPFKGGLLWWSSVHHDAGAFGRPLYAFWRRLGNTGPWSVVSFPRELCANTFAVKDLGLQNNELMMISCGGNSTDTPGPWPFFWKVD